MHAVNSTDDELHAAMLMWLVLGPGRRDPFRIGRATWLSDRATTASEFQARFPRCLDKTNKMRKKS